MKKKCVFWIWIISSQRVYLNWLVFMSVILWRWTQNGFELVYFYCFRNIEKHMVCNACFRHINTVYLTTHWARWFSVDEKAFYISIVVAFLFRFARRLSTWPVFFCRLCEKEKTLLYIRRMLCSRLMYFQHNMNRRCSGFSVHVLFQTISPWNWKMFSNFNVHFYGVDYFKLVFAQDTQSVFWSFFSSLNLLLCTLSQILILLRF